MQTTDTVDAPQFVEHKILIVLHVTDKNFDHEVEIARGVVAFGDFVDAAHRFHELFAQAAAVLFEFDVAKHHNRVAHLLGVDLRHIALDVAFALQSALSFESGRGREMHAVGQFFDREFSVALQHTEDFDVGMVYFCHSVNLLICRMIYCR